MIPNLSIFYICLKVLLKSHCLLHMKVDINLPLSNFYKQLHTLEEFTADMPTMDFFMWKTTRESSQITYYVSLRLLSIAFIRPKTCLLALLHFLGVLRHLSQIFSSLVFSTKQEDFFRVLVQWNLATCPSKT